MYYVEYAIPVHSQEVLKTVSVEDTTHMTHINYSIDKYMHANIEFSRTQVHSHTTTLAHTHTHTCTRTHMFLI